MTKNNITTFLAWALDTIPGFEYGNKYQRKLLRKSDKIDLTKQKNIEQ